MDTLDTKTKAPSLFASHSWIGSVLRFFASLKLAVFVLVTLMAVLATGTIIESLHGTEAARITVYDTVWFSLVLLVLGINVTAAAFSRYPWKVRHIGFVITHTGIILVLIGSFMTQQSMIDGQMAIAENETLPRITLHDPVLLIYSEKEQKTSFVNLEKKAFPWHGRREIVQANDGEPLPFRLTVTANYPKARMRENITASESGEPAIKIRLHNDFVDQDVWLFRNTPGFSETQMGPAKLVFAQELLKENAPASGDASNYLEFQFENKNAQIPLKKDLKLPQTFSLEGTPYKVEIINIFQNAAVVGKDLVEQDVSDPAAADNPAVQLILKGEGLEERHTVFSKYPDFPTVHGMKPSDAGVRVFYRMANAGSRGENHEIRFIEKDGKLSVQIIEGMKITTHKAAKGQTIPTGWMGNLTVIAEEFYPHAVLKRSFTPEHNLSENEELLPAIRLEMKAGNETREIWLRQNVKEEITVGNNKFTLMYAQKTIPAGFKLTLRDFKMAQYPGTNDPATFESDVTLKDDSRGISKDANISMNKPLVYRGFRIYQSGYSLPEGEPEISIFSVGKDPGVPVKYLGAIVMVSGIITMFYTRRFSSTAGRNL
jgi:hypothetical protein